jgi:ABC-type amino acid transport substrate-binding protein
MKHAVRWLCLGSALLLAADSPAQAAAAPGAPDDGRLKVATKEAPPFAFKTPEGTWRGLSIDLWERLASDLQLQFDYVELTLPEMLESVETARVDVAVSALTITPDRERALDFTYPYYSAGLGIAIEASSESVILALVTRLISWHFLSAVGGLAGVLFIAGFLVWIFERRTNPTQFGGTRLQGLFHSFWWSAVTMTTVGYGDKAPRSAGGRVVALVWMFASIIIISSFTAGIASSLTASQVAADYLRTKPVDSLVVATVKGSTGEAFARRMGLHYEAFPDVEAALKAVAKGKFQAIVYDLPLLKYHLLHHPEWGVEILPRVLTSETYAIALPSGSPLREPLNRRLLEIERSQDWQALRIEYLGQE